MAKKYHDARKGGMEREFGEGQMISSSDGLFPSGVKMKDYPSAGYAQRSEPYDGISGIDEQENSDAAKLKKRTTRVSF